MICQIQNRKENGSLFLLQKFSGDCSFLKKLGRETSREREVVIHIHLCGIIFEFWFLLCFKWTYKFSLLLVSVKRSCRKSKQVLFPYPLFAEWFQSQHVSKEPCKACKLSKIQIEHIIPDLQILSIIFLAVFYSYCNCYYYYFPLL